MNIFEENRFSGVSEARTVISKYSRAQLRFVQSAFNDYIRAVNKGFEEGKPSNGAQIKSEWASEAVMDEFMTEEEFNELWDAVKVIEEANVHESVALEASSKASQVSKMTRKGVRIPNYDWAKFECGAYVQVTTPQNPALDLKIGSKAGRVVGKVKDTYVYASDNKTNQMGRDNDFKSELDTSAPQSCLVEVHDDYKIKQHGESTNRIIVPVEWLREIDEKAFKDAVNAIPRKGFDKMFNKDKKRLESANSDSENLDWLVVAKSTDTTPDKGNDSEFKRVIGAFSMLIHAEDFISKCLPNSDEGVFEVVSRSSYDEKDYITEEGDKKSFNFKCRQCSNEFVDKYDYPLPADCNACVICPECGGVACVSSSEPIEELKEGNGFGDFDISEPNNFAPNGRSHYSNPKDWKEKHEWVKNMLEPAGYTCKGSSPWNSTWTNGVPTETIKVDYWEDFDLIKEIVEFSLPQVKKSLNEDNSDEVEDVFEYDGEVEVPEDVKHVVIKEGIVEIPDRAFSDRRELKSIEIPSSVTRIGRSAFNDCRNLAELNLPEGLTDIGINAFALCHSLTHLTIPNGITVISKWLCAHCSELKSVDIPESVTEIDDFAFTGCDLIKVDIPSKVTSIGVHAFSFCDNLRSVSGISAKTKVAKNAFKGCDNLVTR